MAPMKESLHEADSLVSSGVSGALTVRVPAGETIAAINRLVASRLKRNLGNAAALAARRLEHFPLAAAAAATTPVGRATSFPSRTAVRAAARLIRKAFHCEKFLFP